MFQHKLMSYKMEKLILLQIISETLAFMFLEMDLCHLNLKKKLSRECYLKKYIILFNSKTPIQIQSILMFLLNKRVMHSHY